MRILFTYIIFFLALTSCDDGDVIVTSFDFDETTLEYCGGPGSYVFFKINSSSNESLSLRIGTQDSIFNVADTLAFQLNGSFNFMNYRTFNQAPGATYFCNSIPPTSPTVTQDYIGTEGIATLFVLVARDDSDGIDEDVNSILDTDMDGLLNFYDFDDDGDNVPTAFEIGPDPAKPQDTDGDGIADYLDIDDDGDGILTREEDANMDLDPRNDITDPAVGADYLNEFEGTQTTVNEYIEHGYTAVSSIDLFANNVVLINGEEQLTQESLPLGSIGSIITRTVTETPEFK